MRSWLHIRLPTRTAISAQSSSVTPSMGTNGTTSAAPMRGCAPWCSVRSMSVAARSTERKAASATAAGGPAKVTTERLWSASEWRSNKTTSGTASMPWAMQSILAESRPSEKLGTHSTSWRGMNHSNLARRQGTNHRTEAYEIVRFPDELQSSSVDSAGAGPGGLRDRYSHGLFATRFHLRRAGCFRISSGKPHYGRRQPEGFARGRQVPGWRGDLQRRVVETRCEIQQRRRPRQSGYQPAGLAPWPGGQREVRMEPAPS